MAKDKAKRSRGSIDNDQGEKQSPPYKMTRNRNNSSEAVPTILDVMAKLAKIEKDIANISNVIKEFESIKGEVQTMKLLMDDFKQQQIDDKKRSVLVRGVKFTTPEKFESRMNTKSALAEFFGKLGLKPHLVDYQRLGNLKNNEDGAMIPIRVQFVDLDQKLDMFDKLKLKGHEMKEITVSNDYPKFQLQLLKQLSAEGYRIRTEVKGTKTRIIPKGLSLVLQKRTTNSEKWTNVSV
jgi:hypothetical protein